MGLLAKYFSHLVQSRGFSKFMEEKHSDEGLVKEVILRESGDINLGHGSVKELVDFIDLAKEHAIIIGANVTEEGRVDLLNPIIKQKRISDYYAADTPPKKMNKSEAVEHNFRKESQDVTGLEQQLVSKYSGFVKISLDKLSVSEKLALPVNDMEVAALAESMSQRFNPALCVLTVTGEDEVFDDDNNYSVIDGVHRLKALKLLDSQGRFDQLPGIKDRKIECFALTSTGDPAIDNYCNLRSNDQCSQFQSKSSLHELIYVFSFLNKSYKDGVKALTAMERMSKLRKIGADELTSLRKISNWPEVTLGHLIDVLKKFERYQTTDATGRGNKMRLQKGEKMPLPKKMFKMLSKCSAELFEIHHERILNRELSLKEVLQNSEEILANQKIKATFAKEAEVASFEVLQKKYPGKINENVTKSFVGAVTGKNRNIAGMLLERFVSGLNDENLKETIQTEELETVFDFGLDKLATFDIVVYNILNDQPDYIDSVIDSVGLQRKGYMAVLIVLHSDKEHRRVISKLDYWTTQNSMEVVQILFEKKIDTCNQEGLVQENLQFAVLFGKFHIFHPPLRVLNAEMKTSLKDVIEKIAPPASKIAVVLTGSQEIVNIHKDGEINECTIIYFAPKQTLERFMKRIAKDWFLIQTC